jgi:hypothetical protein
MEAELNCVTACVCGELFGRYQLRNHDSATTNEDLQCMHSAHSVIVDS